MALLSSQNAATPTSSAPARRSSARIKDLEQRAKASSAKKCPSPATSNGQSQKRLESPATSNRSVQAVQKKARSTPDEQPELIRTTAGKAVGKAVVVPGETGEKNAYTMVTETIRTFNKHYLHFVQEEHNRCQATKPTDAVSKSKEQNGKRPSKQPDSKTKEENAKRASKRPDLKAVSEMTRLDATLYPEKRIGPIPGIDVGHQFFSRAEMVVVGFHQHWLNGIDYIGVSADRFRKEMGLKDYKLPLTISIVLSGQYEDDLDNFDEIVYTGQGGNNLLGDKRQIRDQKMERGNLGLKNCMEDSVPVRVIRGHDCPSSYVGRVYTYDGLYKVVAYWAEKGVSGFTVYKFRLKRLEDQPPLTTEQVHFTRGRVPSSISEIRGLVCKDITRGLEVIPIPVTNLVDDSPIAPASGFTYIKKLEFSKNIRAPTVAPLGCNCQGDCVDSRSCACAKLNGGDLPYVRHKGGRLVEPKALIFECGPNCKCGPGCVNKTSQNGPQYRLEVYRTPKKGWGVRSWDYIPSGAPVCEYIGLVKRTNELDPAADNTYVFDIDCLQTMKGLDGRESRLRDVCLPSHLRNVGENISENVPFCIDAGQRGNVARFINHSCQPNLFVQCVLSNHHDIKLARIILVAADNIPPLKELTYDYGYALDSVVGPDGKIRREACYCGAHECRKRLY